MTLEHNAFLWVNIQRHLGFTDADKKAWLEVNSKYYDDPEQGWQAKLSMHAFPQRSAMVYVMPAYQSPIDGRWIDTPSQRRDDLARNGCRPWEGLNSEKKEAKRREEALDREMDQVAEKIAVEAWQTAAPEVRQALS